MYTLTHSLPPAFLSQLSPPARPAAAAFNRRFERAEDVLGHEAVPRVAQVHVVVGPLANRGVDIHLRGDTQLDGKRPCNDGNERQRGVSWQRMKRGVSHLVDDTNRGSDRG